MTSSKGALAGSAVGRIHTPTTMFTFGGQAGGADHLPASSRHWRLAASHDHHLHRINPHLTALSHELSLSSDTHDPFHLAPAVIIPHSHIRGGSLDSAFRIGFMSGTSNGGEMEAAAKKKGQGPAQLPWTVRLQVLALCAACDFSQRRDGTVNRFLFSLADRQSRASSRPDARGVCSADVTVDASRNLWARVYTTSADQAGAAPLPVVVYFHGGGFALLSAASTPLDAMCRRFCRELGAVVVSVNYRLAPEHRYPAAYEDGLDILRYLGTNGLPADLGVPVDLSRCFLAGDSAGGNIAHHVAHRWTMTSSSSSVASSKNSVRLAGIILLQPYFGGEERTEAELRLEGVAPIVNMRRSDWSWRAFLPEGADRNHPAAHVTGEAGYEPELPEAFPPAMVVVGGLDPLQDWQRRYAGMLQRKGKAAQLVEFPDAIHTFYMFPKLPDAGKLDKEMKAFIEINTPDH